MEMFQLVTFVFAGRYIQRSSAIVPWLWCFLAGTQPSTPKKLHKSIPFMKGRFWKWKSELELLRIGENTHQKSVAQHCVSRMSWRKRDTFWLKFWGKMAVSSLELQVFMWVDGDVPFFPSTRTRKKFHRGPGPSSSFSANGSTKSFCSWCNSSTNSRWGRHGNCGCQRGRGKKTWKLLVTCFPWKKSGKTILSLWNGPFLADLR